MTLNRNTEYLNVISGQINSFSKSVTSIPAVTRDSTCSKHFSEFVLSHLMAKINWSGAIY